MKNKKLLVLILSLALLISGILCVSVSAETEADPTEVSIYKKNLSFVNSPALAFAVAHDGSASKVSLNVWNAEPAEGTAPDYVVTESSAQNVGGVDCSVFYINGKNPKNISEQVWVQAVAGDVKSETVRFSILEFALAGIAGGTDVERYQSIIDYATSAQKWLGYTDANGKTADEYVYVTIEGGTVNGYSTGVYPKGTVITPVGENVSTWSVVSGGATNGYSYGQPITLEANAKISPDNSAITFEDCTSPSEVPGASYVNGGAFEIGEVDSNVLTADTVNDGLPESTTTKVIFGLENTTTDANAVVFEFDLYIDRVQSEGTIWDIRMRDTAANQIVQLDINQKLILEYVTDGPQSLQAVSTEGWLKIRIEYIDLGETYGLRVYLGGNRILNLKDYVCTKKTPASREVGAITDVQFMTYEEIVTHFDNVVFKQEKINLE